MVLQDAQHLRIGGSRTFLHHYADELGVNSLAPVSAVNNRVLESSQGPTDALLDTSTPTLEFSGNNVRVPAFLNFEGREETWIQQRKIAG